MDNKQKNVRVILLIIGPILFGMIIASAYFANEFLENNLSEILKNTVNLLATLFGFILASLTILVSFEGNEKTKQIRNSRHYKKILGIHLISDIWMFFGMSCLSVCNMFGLINKTVSWMLIWIVSVSFAYIVIVLYYLAIMIGTLFVEKKEYY